MELHALKLTLVQHILNTDRPEVLKEILTMFPEASPDLWDEISDETKEEIEIARNQIARGEGTDWQTLYQRLKKQA